MHRLAMPRTHRPILSNDGQVLQAVSIGKRLGKVQLNFAVADAAEN
jgi:hypothetical protein